MCLEYMNMIKPERGNKKKKYSVWYNQFIKSGITIKRAQCDRKRAQISREPMQKKISTKNERKGNPGRGPSSGSSTATSSKPVRGRISFVLIKEYRIKTRGQASVANNNNSSINYNINNFNFNRYRFTNNNNNSLFRGICNDYFN